jgi:ABC-type Mn2+/Zn2+ transport system permease subunit
VLGVVGLLAGTVASLEMSLPTGACIVLALTAVFGVSACFERLTGRRARVGSRAVAAEGINGAGF